MVGSHSGNTEVLLIQWKPTRTTAQYSSYVSIKTRSPDDWVTDPNSYPTKRNPKSMSPRP